MVLLICLTRAALSAAGVLGEERPQVRSVQRHEF
jgi:hypothetical protein